MGDKKKKQKNKANTRNQFSNCEYMFTLSTILAKKNYEKNTKKKTETKSRNRQKWIQMLQLKSLDKKVVIHWFSLTEQKKQIQPWYILVFSLETILE